MIGRFACALTLFVSGAANAGLMVDLVGKPGDSVVTVSASGSFTVTDDVDAYFFGRGSGWNAGFAANSTINNGGGLTVGDRAPVLSGDLSVTNGTDIFALSISIDGDASAADDFGFFKTDGSEFQFLAGQSWTVSGLSTFDLGQLGNLDPAQMPTFSDLGLGTFSTNLSLGGAANVLADTISLKIVQVPEPATFALFGLGLMGLKYRKRT